MAHRVRRPGRFRNLRTLAVMAVVALTAPAALAPSAAQAAEAGTANAVIAWNTHAQTTIFEVGKQSPTASARSFAMVQGAVYDAVNAIAGTPYEPYLVA